MSDGTDGIGAGGKSDGPKHDDYRIGLYYCFFPASTVVETAAAKTTTEKTTEEEVAWQQKICERLELRGRIRVSAEGLNGVLSGLRRDLLQYEQDVCRRYGIDTTQMDLKLCELRKDLETKPQLFEVLSVKATREVISLHDPPSNTIKRNKRLPAKGSKGYYRRRRRNREKPLPVGVANADVGPDRKEEEEEEEEAHHENGKIASSLTASCVSLPLHRSESKSEARSLGFSPSSIKPAPHLSPSEWNTQLQQHQGDGSAVLLDARNLYESRIGHFRVPGVPTLLPHTRKYSSLPTVLQQHKHLLQDKHIYMYCTGGVRCEKASVYVQTLLEGSCKSVSQLKGGIQRYLEHQQQQRSDKQGQEDCAEDSCPSLFEGKNFCFDPRRTDPTMASPSGAAIVVGRCVLCRATHDDYDNGHAPRENREARCFKCRVLVLVCNNCRDGVIAWGEHVDDGTHVRNSTSRSGPAVENDLMDRPKLYCGGIECVGEGNFPGITVLE